MNGEVGGVIGWGQTVKAVLGLGLLLWLQVGEYQGRILSDKIIEEPFIHVDSLLIAHEPCGMNMEEILWLADDNTKPGYY